MREHPAKSDEDLATIPGLYKHAAIARAHHEWVDGSGYPDRISRNEIPIAARIVAVADAFDAMIAARPYRPAFSIEETLTHLTEASGTHLIRSPSALTARWFVRTVRSSSKPKRFRPSSAGPTEPRTRRSLR